MVESRGAGCYEAVSLSTGIAFVLRVLNRAMCDWCLGTASGRVLLCVPRTNNALATNPFEVLGGRPIRLPIPQGNTELSCCLTSNPGSTAPARAPWGAEFFQLTMVFSNR